MAAAAPLIKQIAAGRRKPNMTRKEYFDHRFRVHGAISDGVDDKNLKPHKYVQTQIFDSVFGSRANGPLNANQNWCGRDDTTELFFRDWDHVLGVFKSDYVKQKVGPDGPLFADFETSMVLLAYEKPLSLQTRLQEQKSGVSLDAGNATVAMYFISTEDNQREGEQLEKVLSPALKTSLETCAQDDAWGLIANVGMVSSKFDLNAYFGGSNMPQYAVVYKIFLRDNASVPVFRKAQADFVRSVGEHFDQHESFVLFGKEALIQHHGNDDIRFSPDRQPDFSDLPGPSHLDK